MNKAIDMKLRLLARSLTQRSAVALLFLAPVVSMASVIGSCGPGLCHDAASETIVGNLVTIDFYVEAEHGADFTLNETLITDSSGGPPAFLGLVHLTLWADAFGGAAASGTLGAFQCGVFSNQIPGPDTNDVFDFLLR
jgi:hypothetical protein